MPMVPIARPVTEGRRPTVDEEVSSASSRVVQHSTLFCDFSLTATPVYSRYVPDEENTPPDPNTPVPELPRLILLEWRRAPDLRRPDAPSATKARMSAVDTAGSTSIGGVQFGDLRESMEAIRRSTANSALPGGKLSVRGAVTIPEPSKRPQPEEPPDGSERPSAAAEAHLGDRTRRALAAGRPLAPTSQGRSYLVNFVDAAFVDGAIAESRVSAVTHPHHVDSIAALSELAEGIAAADVTAEESEQPPVPSFPAAGSEPESSYVGYHIERYRLRDGVYSLDREFDLDDAGSHRLVDTDVLYGVSYRYRIRALMRVVAMTDPTQGFAPAEARYLSSEWSREWAYADMVDSGPPSWPDELTVRPDSHRSCVHVSWKIPADPQGDLLAFRLFRKELRTDGSVGPWVDLGTFPPANGLFIDTAVGYFQDGAPRYAYAMQTASVHGELSPLSEQLTVALSRTYRVTGEEPVGFFSMGGLTLEDSPALSLPLRPEPMVPSGLRLALSARTGPAASLGSPGDYRARLTSLVTGQSFDVPLTVRFRTLPPRPAASRPPSPPPPIAPNRPSLPPALPPSGRPQDAKFFGEALRIGGR